MTDMEKLEAAFTKFETAMTEKLDSFNEKLTTLLTKFESVSPQLVDHEQRIRVLEKSDAVTVTKLALYGGVSGLIGSLITAVILKTLFH